MNRITRFNLIAWLIVTMQSGLAFAENQVIAPDWSMSTPSGHTVTLSEEVENQTTEIPPTSSRAPHTILRY